MSVEQLQARAEYSETQENNRRTDDILFNLHYLRCNILDEQNGIFDEIAEADILEQNSTEIAEADIHKLGVVVYQKYDKNINQFVSLGAGTVEHANNGIKALDLSDLSNWFEYERRVEEALEETRILEPQTIDGMKAGGVKVFISPSPTHHEADPDIACDFGYDDRTMIRLQTLSADGKTKKMQSFSVFNITAKAWSEYLSIHHNSQVGARAIDIMRFTGNMGLEFDAPNEVLEKIIKGVANYVAEEDKEGLEIQLEAFLENQSELSDHAKHYANEKLKFQKELALSFNGWAGTELTRRIDSLKDKLNPNDRRELSKRSVSGRLFVDEYVARLLSSVNTLTTSNRAGLATLNERTVGRVASSIGLEATIDLASRERIIQQSLLDNIDPTFLLSRSEQQIADSGVSCGGGCSVDVVGLFSSDSATAKQAGLTGTLYKSKELNHGSKCSCVKNFKKPDVVVDGKNAVCLSCGDFNVAGKKGNIKKKHDDR